jgi:hypothetical protein
MNKDDALADLHDHERDVRTIINAGFMLLSATYIIAAIGFATDSGFAVITAFVTGVATIFVFSIGTGTVEDGLNRRFWKGLSSGMDGVPLETKREALEPYRITDESDLEDILQ